MISRVESNNGEAADPGELLSPEKSVTVTSPTVKVANITGPTAGPVYCGIQKILWEVEFGGRVWSLRRKPEGE